MPPMAPREIYAADLAQVRLKKIVFWRVTAGIFVVAWPVLFLGAWLARGALTQAPPQPSQTSSTLLFDFDARNVNVDSTPRYTMMSVGSRVVQGVGPSRVFQMKQYAAVVDFADSIQEYTVEHDTQFAAKNLAPGRSTVLVLRSNAALHRLFFHPAWQWTGSIPMDTGALLGFGGGAGGDFQNAIVCSLSSHSTDDGGVYVRCGDVVSVAQGQLGVLPVANGGTDRPPWVWVNGGTTASHASASDAAGTAGAMLQGYPTPTPSTTFTYVRGSNSLPVFSCTGCLPHASGAGTPQEVAHNVTTMPRMTPTMSPTK